MGKPVNIILQKLLGLNPFIKHTKPAKNKLKVFMLPTLSSTDNFLSFFIIIIINNNIIIIIIVIFQISQL